MGAGVVRKETAQRGKLTDQSVTGKEEIVHKRQKEKLIYQENISQVTMKEVKVHSGAHIWKSSNRKTCMSQERKAYN